MRERERALSDPITGCSSESASASQATRHTLRIIVPLQARVPSRASRLPSQGLRRPHPLPLSHSRPSRFSGPHVNSWPFRCVVRVRTVRPGTWRRRSAGRRRGPRGRRAGPAVCPVSAGQECAARQPSRGPAREGGGEDGPTRAWGSGRSPRIGHDRPHARRAAR